MTMTRLYVYLLQGTNWTAKDSYVKFQLGNFESKTRVFKNTTDPIWNEEFVFRIHDLDAELVVSVYHHNDSHSGLFNRSAYLVGRVRIPLSSVANEDNHTLPPTWFSLEKPKNMKSIGKDSGKILLSLSLHGRGQEASNDHKVYLNPSIANGNSKSCETTRTASHKNKGKHLMKSITGRFERLFSKNEEPSKSDDSSELSTTISDDCTEEISSTCSFEEPFENMNSINENRELPDNLQGGVLLDQTYLVSPKDLNKFIFSPNSKFQKDLAEMQGTKDVQEGPWIYKLEEEASCLTRVVAYTKAASKLVKSVKATEEQSYLKANGKEFAVFVSVSTPDVPYGSTFKIELLYKIIPGPESSSSGKESSRLVISWGINFVQNTMMRCMIEGGARQGLKDNFDQLSDLLAQNFGIMKSEDVSDRNKTLANLETTHQSYWQLAIEYFCNFTVFSTVCMVLYVFVHILLCRDNNMQGLEFHGLNLPDNFGELITAGIIVLHLERVYEMVTYFVQATLQRRSDHGVKSQGDGWVLTVALIEATHLASLGLEGSPDPYVMFSCNGKTRTSSVKLQTLDPQWNELLEFDAAEEPPSVLDVEVFDFDGPFDQATSLGHAEINFLKHTSTELADIWVPLEGKLAKSSQSKLHLRIFLDNNNGVETIKDYLTKMEKEVGKKLNLRSPHRNSTFQKIFGLPPEEFLISDFTCSLKRKMPLQGKLFLSARMVGFYANLFGHKTKFFFLWEDIEVIQVLPPSLASVGSPSLVIVLRPGRGVDAKHGAKTQDDQGRLSFHFHSFVSFNAASRTIMALWRTRTLSPYQKAEIVVEHEHDDGESLLMVEDAKMTKVYSAELHVNMKSVMQIFDGGDLEDKVMEKSGCLNYIATNWEQVGPDVYERRLCYKFDRHISKFGGEVTCTQQKSPTVDSRGWIVNEIMVLHDVPFDDHFRVQFRYEVESSANGASSCKCDVYIGVVFLKSSKFQQRIIRNVTEKFGQRLREIYEHVEKEILLGS